MKTAVGLCVLSATFAAASPSEASTYNFSITVIGQLASEDLSSDPIVGTSLDVGDTYALDVHAAEGFFWGVSGGLWNPNNLNFVAYDYGYRTGHVITSFLLDGNEVFQRERTLTDAFIGIGEGCCSNFGAPIPIGTAFDQVVSTYSLLATTSTYTTIQPYATLQGSANLAFGHPFFQQAGFYYLQDGQPIPVGEQSSAVPIPAALPLLASGLGGIGLMGWMARRRRGQGVHA